MSLEALRPPITTTDPADTSPLLQVPLANSDKSALIAPEDYRRVLSAGFSPNWYLHCGGYVTTYRASTGYARVSRIILGIAEPGHRKIKVSHSNGDLTDLRRKNLVTNEVNETKPRYGRDDRRPNAPEGAGWRK
ncbi:hypothetical protein [Bosea sp. UNC402CLCol]|uniref:hypothetical protein n=1 Tax=Bosea sp. UNC402CLCol TaxID=1510531 RepID=UPI00057144B2|nr:hypothetical protein [Bosea sp. UNC402CLCol]